MTSPTLTVLLSCHIFRKGNKISYNVLTSAELLAIGNNLKSLTTISREHGPVIYDMPDSITYRNVDREIIGTAVYEGDFDEWVFRPIPNIPPPPTF